MCGTCARNTSTSTRSNTPNARTSWPLSAVPDPHLHAAAQIAAGVQARLQRQGASLAEAAPRLAQYHRPDFATVTPVDAWTVGEAYQAVADPRQRRARGAFYTPPGVARGLVAALGRPGDLPAPTYLDPACGPGVFLVAAATALHEHGVPARDVVAHHVAGCDTDPVAVAIAEAALAMWALDHGVEPVASAVAVGDGLLDPPRRVGGAAPGAVIGNPPFLGQLRTDTTRDPALAGALADRLGPLASGYVDTASLFLCVAADLVSPGGVVCLIQPESFLSARDSGSVRRWLTDRATLEALWLGGDGGFDAAVRVCAPVLRRGAGKQAPVRILHGSAVQVNGRARLVTTGSQSTWSSLLAHELQVPDPDLVTAGRLGDLAQATADFRDQYYGLVPGVREAGPDGGGPRLVTTGLVDPARLLWGAVPARFAKQRWVAPTVDRSALSPEMTEWLDRRCVPKVLVASQTRVLEAVADPEGSLVPVTPLVTVTPRCGSDLDLWKLLAVLVSPVASLWAMRRYAGAAMATDAIKVSASQILDLPLPADGRAWAAAGRHVRRAQAAPGPRPALSALHDAARATCAAYRIDEPERSAVVEWWSGRLPRRAERT